MNSLILSMIIIEQQLTSNRIIKLPTILQQENSAVKWSNSCILPLQIISAAGPAGPCINMAQPLANLTQIARFRLSKISIEFLHYLPSLKCHKVLEFQIRESRIADIICVKVKLYTRPIHNFLEWVLLEAKLQETKIDYC